MVRSRHAIRAVSTKQQTPGTRTAGAALRLYVSAVYTTLWLQLERFLNRIPYSTTSLVTQVQDLTGIHIVLAKYDVCTYGDYMSFGSIL